MERRDFELPDPDWMRDLSHCPLSDRDKELLEKFWTELENDRMEHCARCQETWFDMGLKGGICKRCIARDKNKKEDEPWFFSAENQLDFGLIPAFLPQLTIVEEMLIARVHVFVNVMQVRGQQYKYRGHIVHFLRDVGKVYSQLPLLPPELDVILLRPPTASEHAHLNRQFRRQFRVRRRCLQEWLNFLSNNHPGYRGITVCQKRMSVLPEDGDVLDQVATAAVTDPLSANLGNIENDDVEPDEVDQSAVPDLLPEDTEMEALRSHVLGEERGEHLPVRPSTQHQLEMPDIRRTPINEFNHSQALLSLAFPTLFPRGQADFVEPRLRPIKYADYIQHALRWHDGRFARHPTFRFVVFNTLMRAQARAKSSYFVKEYQQRQGLITRDDLLEAFQNPESAEAQQLLNSINRQTAQLRGTRPYWYRKRRELESYAYNLDCPGAFITFSPADLHWRSLYQHLPQFQDWQELPEQQRMGMSSKLLRDNPHIAAWHFYRRFGLFRDIVLKQKFNVTDYWNRYEWQGRGSSHCHGLFWMDGAPSVDLENEHLRKEFARIWRFHVTAFNPEPARVRQQGEGNPLAVNPLQHPLTFQWLSQVLNRCQRHHCSETYCLRKKKGSEEISCRFFFPRDTRDTADVVRRQGQSYFSFEAARNDSLMNHYNRCLSLGWLANIDISPCTSLQAVINYAAKYCSKMEKRTDSYASMGRQILPYVSHQNPLLSFASRLMNKLLTERDFSGQEICHVLLNCELQEGTRVIRAVDCRPYEQQGRSLRLQGDHDDAEVVGIYEKYLSRPPLHEELTYLDFLANWNTSKRDGRKWTRWSRQAKPRVLYYFPRYKSNHQHHQYDDFCRVKLMLAHPHRDPNELRKINGVEYNSYASAAEFCYGNHRHPDDYYGTPNAEERRPDPDEFEEEFHEPDLLEEDWLELARQLPDCPPSQEAIDLLGRRDIDIQYDWTPHVGRYADPGIVQGDYWRQRIEQNRLYMDVEDMPLEVRDALNPEQRIVYDTFIGHFQCGSEEQILLHVDGGGGTGKSYMIKVLSSHLQRLAGNRPSPIWRAAPTGVASNQIMGTTLHSLLRLPMDRAFTELSPADANAIQKKLRDVRYLVIDEKSMLGLRQLSWIDKRLRQVFPARAAEFFGGISIILVGDFFQLPPIANKPLYFDGPLKDLHEVSGQTAYRAFNHTVFLKKVQRQQGDDQAGFRLALEELRGLKLSIESWKLLSQRVQVKLSQREEDTFDAALRIYSKKARVNEYNYEHLVRLKHPAIQVMAKNIGNGADKATSEQAGNLAGQFPPAGLVNGAQGTVYDIGWAPGADAHRDPPSVIMMVMDKYTGPSYLTTDDGREVVPILPVKRDFFLGTSACTRKQFPLMASYAITVHKSQSITVDKMVTDLSERDFQTGLSYVAVSRVKMLDGLMIDAPFERASLHYEKLPDGKHSVLMKVRDQDRQSILLGTPIATSTRAGTPITSRPGPSIASQEGVRLGTPIESPVSSPSIWPRPARERHSRPPVQLQQSAIERPVMERRDFELPDPDWMRDLSHCPLSDRDKELLEKFWTELENDRMEHCARCQETWFDMGLKGGICKRCIARDKNKKEDEPWFFSAENQLDFGLIPAFLPQLTIVEEMLIARVHVFVNVMQVRGQQYKYRGHIVHFLRDVGKVYSQLPLLPPELDVILLRPPTASEHAHLNRQFRRQFRVRRRCLQEWLNFLSNNHPGYRGITVCQKRMSVLPEDGDVLDQVATAAVTDPLSANLGNIENDDVEPDEVDQSAVPDLLPEDTEMEALRSHVLGEERGEHLPVRPSTQHQLEMPDIRRTPINEFNHSQALLSLAFPTLFPRGQADFVEPRLRPIKYADYIQHALRWHDGRFARHPTFRFVVFNTLMRAQARAKSSYFVKEYQQRQGLITRDDLLEAFQNPESAEAQQLLNSINRQTAQLRGTRPYWYRKRRELESYAYNLDCPGAFITFSPADLHWRSLYQHLPQFQDWQELPEQQRMGMSSKLLRDNPHIAAWHFYRRFGLFRDIVLKQKFNVTDYWNRYEWQGRGSSHCHGLFWMDGAPSVDLENEHLRKEFARIWRFHVTAFNPEPARVRQQGEGNPLAVNPLQHPLTFQWLSQVLNRCQRHHCSETYCLRKKKGSEEISCRFFFPRDTRDTADVVRRQGQSYFSFEAARNDSLMNHYNRCLSLGWLANIDISPCTSLQAVINYAAKYCSKMEKRTDSYASMGRQILPYVSHQNPLLSFASRLMNKLLTERDFSGQEICHVLLNCELQEGTRVIRAVDCRPYEQQGRSLRLQGDHDDAEVVGIYEKYLSRPPLHEELTYLDFLANWNTSKRDGRKWTRWSRQAKPRVLYYFPRYKSNHQHHQYDDFCRVKLMLAHPHRDPNELRKINGVEYNSYASAAEFCYGNHRHPDDYYGTPNAEERRPDPDEFEEEFHEPDLLEEDWLELARQLPDCPPSQEAIDLLGRRDIDIQYDWTPHVGRYADPGIVQGDYWRQRIEQNRLYMDVEDMPLEVRDALNPEQRIVYDTFIGHFQCGSEEQILLHVDGGGGTGKSYMIKVLSSHLQRLAGNRPSPIWRAAPTGVASNQIMGTTLHSLLRLPMDRAFTELSPADANAIQKKLRDVRYLVIDEKSMLGLRQLSWIDKRLRQVFPARAAEFFGGISIILVGDFFQLPPIANKPLYFDGPLKDLHEVSGQTAYRAFNHTVFLKKVQRQQGDDQAGFRLALEELRGLKLSIESWKLLSQRVQVKLSQREEDTFDAALRIYSKKARVNEYNYEHLVRLKHPAIQVMAKNIGNGADKATSEQAGNLAGQFPPAGLVNGAQGTVYDIGWAPGADAHRDPPSVIMMVMDKYTGPSYLTTDDGREVVPILPVKRDFFLGTSACTRKQFPLMASYAITVHKSQSITVDKMVTDLSERDFQTGLSYVAVSRVKMLDGLMIDAPFERASLHYEKLPDGKHSVLMKVRDQDRRLQLRTPINPQESILLGTPIATSTRAGTPITSRPGPSIASQEGVRLGTPIESPVSSPSIWPRPARERHSRPPVQLQQSAIERPVMERRDFELPDPDWMRDLSHCPLSDRDKELLEKFWTELENDRMEHCARCQETWFDMGLKGGICKRCIARDKNKKEDEPWFFSAENQLDFGLIPAFLPQLTIVEEMLIARVHVFVNVMQVRGQQYKYRGHIVHFLRDVGKVYSQLPLLPPELDVILLRPPTASEHAHLNRQFRRQFRVRRRCLQEWLNFLSNNHPGYRGITVCQKRMSVLPEDGDVLDQVATAAVTDPLSANLGNIENDDVEPDEVDQSAVPDLLPEDTEMEALRSHVLGEERGEHLPVRPSTQHQLEMPDIRRTPINEFNHSQALLSLAFPTLFPRGQADFVEPRLRPIKYADYIQHALRWHDGRFARHPTFRFVVFNTLMRAQARAKSSYFVKEYQQRQGLITRDDLLEAFQNPESAEAQQLLNSINRQTAQLRGTRPYWYRKRRELESYAYNLDCPGAFITFSPADLHWRSLYQHLPQFQDWQELPEQQRMGMSSKLLRDNPHIAAWHFYRRFGLFRDIVLKQKFNVTDYWNRYEWQGRGSSHCHGLFWMDGAPSVDLENEHLRKEFARIWRFHVTAFNPEPARVRQQGEGNPLAVNPLQHPLTFQWLSQVLNRCQRHHCSETYCLRKKKGSEEISCRFFFPRDTRDTADVVRRQGQSYFSFEAARNDSLMNHYNRCLSLGWLANIDISPCTSLQAVINYAAKYCSKMEKRTDSYASMGRQILPYVSHQNPLLSFASRLMNKLLTERDFSGQEICHVLLNCELQEGTRVIRAVDCRPYEQQGRSLRLQGDHDDAEVVGIYEKYLSRPPLHEELTYLDFLANWNTSKRDGRKWTRWSRQAKPRVLYYFPRYKSNHQHHQYDDFCRVKLMLAHPHRDPNELRKINGVEYNSYASAAEFCYGNHRHPDDYYGTPNAEERRPDPDEFEEEFHEPDLLEEDWLELARQLPDCPPSQEAIDLLGRRDIDIQYDWTPHVGRYADPGIVQGDYWRQRIEQNRLYMDVEDMPLEVRDALNPEQRIVYDTFIGHFQCGSEEQILLHVDGGGGTGKSYMIKVLSSHLQRLAGNRPSPIWRAAPTGVASNQIMGTTLHSLLRLPMDRAFTELSPADANAIQKKLRDVRYLVIDEKSMLGLRQLSWIDKRLRQVFPARAAEFFGGISIILVGDFFQLPPIANKPLYFDGPLKDLHEVSGQTAYRAFNHTVFLKKVQRQQGDDQAGFRLALEELRGLKLSIESWKLLSQRVQVKLSQREEDTFDAALRIYSKKARVNEYNYEHLVRLKHPAIQVMAKNIGNGADKATSEQAGNLAGQFPPAGLVNGAQGTVYDIGWAPGADAHRDPPSVIMMVMDKYTGPSYLTTDDGREVVPILPVKRDFFLGTSACTRKQFPLMASYAITVHKSQSITVDKMVTDLSERDFQTGLSYVAVSRVKMLDGLMIDAPFERASLHYEKLPDGKHSSIMLFTLEALYVLTD
ncbi:hypothetical protein HZS61_004134 [Fusarium oxysporum f. sp. conglutinans]|uniref:ATP-dependent DNA helicase n=5 Tax=Fusarium oxysporum TaxID=5507 RepID=A0A8H6LF76_FUSOX|nr:hypothetical protein HZS61_004134 [Fusarium oxysporum f. sp. conglutinans]